MNLAVVEESQKGENLRRENLRRENLKGENLRRKERELDVEEDKSK
jgi:hypothetical protein